VTTSATSAKRAGTGVGGRGTVKQKNNAAATAGGTDKARTFNRKQLYSWFQSHVRGELELFDRINRIYKSIERQYGLVTAIKHCSLKLLAFRCGGDPSINSLDCWSFNLHIEVKSAPGSAWPKFLSALQRSYSPSGFSPQIGSKDMQHQNRHFD
jgi:hypothetical protein